jgi:uncharacterized membrane protein YhfC
MARHMLAIMLAMACVASRARADALLDQKGEFGPEPQSERQQIAFEVPEDTPRLSLDATLTLTQGKASVQVVSPKGTKLFDAGTSRWMTLSGSLLRTGGEAGTFLVVLVPDKAVGTWTVTIRAAGPIHLRNVYLMLVSAIGMIAVGGVAVGIWRFSSRVPWRWFWVGAAVWTAGVALKFACAILLNKPILGALKTSLSSGAYLALGSVYIGILTGVFEIGVTLIAGLIWRGMARNAARGLAVGIGAGAFEAVLVGVAVLLSAIGCLVTTGPTQDQILAATTSATSVTPLFWLAGPIERVIALACHVASRALVLVGIARGKWGWPFTIAFLLMSAIDAVAGYFYLARLVGRISTWWMELAITPAALASIPLLLWSIRHWPACEKEEPAPVS